MSNRRQFFRQTVAIVMAFGLIVSLLPGFTAAQDQVGDSFTVDRCGDLAPIENNG